MHVNKFIKTLPSNLDSLLTSPLALAVWYMDDGTKQTDCNAGRIATQGFTRAEQNQLIDCVESNFSIQLLQDVWHDENNKELLGLSIPSTRGHFEKWCDLIRPYIEKYVPSMNYKLYNSN